jgi:RimJ/RimL family protein N-acetyltransferase
MIEFIPFTQYDFERLKSWINNKEELFQFAGPLFNFPLTDEQLLDYINRKDKKPFKVVLNETNETIGHCELNYESGNNRLSRILIGKEEYRNKKLGEQIVRKMVNLFFLDPTIKLIDLNVFDCNTRAIKCYEKVGFRIIYEKTDQLLVYGNIWTRLNMQLKRDDYII